MRIVSETEREARDESDDDREGVAATPEGQVSFGNDAFFSWAKTATVNGATVNVISSTLSSSSDSTDVDGDRKRDGGCNKRDGGGCDNSGSGSGDSESSSKIVFSFDVGTPGAIVWDPKIGYTSASSAAMVVPSLLFAILLAML